jgi:hypothetical protein
MTAGAQWYVAREGQVVGPLPAHDLADLARASDAPVLVWAEGLDGWTQAGEVAALRDVLGLPVRPDGSAADDVTVLLQPRKLTVAERARRELVEYAAIAAYLYVCFGALILYKASILRGEGIVFAPLGFAVAKALILGKFLLLLKAVHVGEVRSGHGRMVLDIARKALVFALLLVVLSVVEEIGVGWFHGKTPARVLADMTGDSVLQVLATTLLMVLVLVPYFAFHEITEQLGEGELLRMLVARKERGHRRPAAGGEHDRKS